MTDKALILKSYSVELHFKIVAIQCQDAYTPVVWDFLFFVVPNNEGRCIARVPYLIDKRVPRLRELKERRWSPKAERDDK